MTDYWRSHPKKYCKFCKCWIADNKPSVSFHEKGKKHHENVAQRAKEISDQSLQDYKEKLKIEAELNRMEKEAMKACMKDVEANGDYTSQILNKGLDAERNAQESTSSIDNSVYCSKKNKCKHDAGNAKEWYEAVSDEGHSYYWNVHTRESVWEPPSDGYVPLVELREKEKKESETWGRNKEKEGPRKKDGEINKKWEEASISEEQRASLQRKKMREAAVTDKPEPRQMFIENPYGKWTSIKHREQKSTDLQLPQHKLVIFKGPAIKLSEPEIKFKEIIPGTLQGNDTLFKKRKLSFSCKANTRRRTEDD